MDFPINNSNDTQEYEAFQGGNNGSNTVTNLAATKTTVASILHQVCQALYENGYNPLDQIVGYLISGDPTYITNHQNARVLIRQLERDQILDELIQTYFKQEGIR